jgi:hypothetical protein
MLAALCAAAAVAAFAAAPAAAEQPASDAYILTLPGSGTVDPGQAGEQTGSVSGDQGVSGERSEPESVLDATGSALLGPLGAGLLAAALIVGFALALRPGQRGVAA